MLKVDDFLCVFCLFDQRTPGPDPRLQPASGVLPDPLPHHSGDLPHPHRCFHGKAFVSKLILLALKCALRSDWPKFDFQVHYIVFFMPCG